MLGGNYLRENKLEGSSVLSDKMLLSERQDIVRNEII